METASIGLLAAALDTSISMDQKVPALTIICIVLSLIMCVGAPIGFFLVIRKRIRVVGQAVIFGVLGYMVASTILVQLTFGLILMMPGATDLLNNNPAIQRILGVALTALYEVLGFFLGLKFLQRTLDRRGYRMDLGCALLFSLGYTAAAVISVTSSGLIQYLMVASSINGTGMQALVDAVEESAQENFLLAMNEFINSPSANYLLDGLSAVFHFVFRTCLAILCYGVLSGKMKTSTMAVAVGAEAVFVIPLLLVYLGVFPTMWFVEICYLIIDGLLVYYVLRVLKDYMKDEWEKLLEKPKDNNNRPGGKQQKMPKIVMPKD